MPLIITKGGIIGRANNCDISVPFDSLMSLIHCKIFVKEGSFYIKDINSKNSTWIRLSPEGEFSDGYSLKAGDVVKVGLVTFLVESGISSKNIDPNKTCKNCGLKLADTDLLPCGHNACIDCACKLIICYICNKDIKEIFRN